MFSGLGLGPWSINRRIYHMGYISAIINYHISIPYKVLHIRPQIVIHNRPIGRYGIISLLVGACKVLVYKGNILHYNPFS